MNQMMMDDQVEVLGSKDQTHIIKGKRSRRQRQPSPLSLAMASSTSSARESGDEGGRMVSYNSGGLDRGTASPTSTVEFRESAEEEDQDMANCLILLAQGRHTQKLSSQPVVAAPASAGKAAGLYVYQCKTCNRCFPSFQALGGHRASHKKPKVNKEEKKALRLVEEEEDHFNNMNTTLSLQITNRAAPLCNINNKSKVHECSICGAEFASGQALGGHMRRHRTFASTPTTGAAMSLPAASIPDSRVSKKPRNSLQLDLNLPAPEDDNRESKFPFAAKDQVIVFSSSPLVDCHY